MQSKPKEAPSGTDHTFLERMYKHQAQKWPTPSTPLRPYSTLEYLYYRYAGERKHLFTPQEFAEACLKLGLITLLEPASSSDAFYYYRFTPAGERLRRLPSLPVEVFQVFCQHGVSSPRLRPNRIRRALRHVWQKLGEFITRAKTSSSSARTV